MIKMVNFRTLSHKIENKFPRSEIKVYQELVLQKTLYWRWSERLNALVGKKVLQPEERFRNELEKNKAFEKENILVPEIYYYDKITNSIFFEFIKGKNGLEYLNEEKDMTKKVEFARKSINNITKIHLIGKIHGDPQIKNQILSIDDKLYEIDLEAEWNVENPRTADLMIRAADLSLSIKNPNLIIQIVDDIYRIKNKLKINKTKYKKSQVNLYKLAYKVNDEFMNYFTRT